jgi:hypothetical protein
MDTEHFAFSCEVSEGGADRKYIIEGNIRYKGAGGFRTLVNQPGAGYTGSRFRLILAKRGVIIDTVAINPGGQDLTRPLPFKTEFTSEPFDSLAISYSVTMRD